MVSKKMSLQIIALLLFLPPVTAIRLSNKEAKNVAQHNMEEQADIWWWSEAREKVGNFFRHAYHMYDAFVTLEACKAMQVLNPIAWFNVIGNVMEFHEGQEDADDIDDKGSKIVFGTDAASVGFELAPETLRENLLALDSEVVHKVWSQRFKNHKVNPITWLADNLDELKPVPRKLDEFARRLSYDVPEEDADPEAFVALVEKIKTMKRQEVAPPPVRSGSSREPVPVLSENGKALAVSGKTDMLENPYWRNKLLKSIWPVDQDGFTVRMAKATVGTSAEEAKIEGMEGEKNKEMIARGKAISTQTNPVTAWLSLDEELLQEIWKEASANLRELPGIDKEATYSVGVTFKSMKAGGLLDKTGKDLPGVVWHKDVYSEYVCIIYPFSFLPGYNNEISTTSIYKEKDPQEEHLGMFTEDLRESKFVETVPPGSSSGFGEIIAFDNMLTRHRAHPPMGTKKEKILEAMYRARDWGVPGIGQGQAVRAMIHISLRKESADLTYFLSEYAPSALISWLKAPLGCLLKLPLLEEWGYRSMGGFRATGAEYYSTTTAEA